MTAEASALGSVARPAVVVKVGGSLFDWPGLRTQLPLFLAGLSNKTVIVVPGGGKAADAVRDLDHAFELGDAISHWLALRALTLNAHFLAELMPAVRVVEGLNASRSAWRRGGVTIIDPFRFARGDEARPDHLPHTWSATSDSVAARVALVAEAERLVLLKSAMIPAEMDWNEAARAGHVDPEFPKLAARAPFIIDTINLRMWRPPS
jgi:5-(aminomethyl)-3-furanmethanol phosphate kinase